MSQAPRGKQDWIRDHYEKAILLVALIALLVSCVWLAQRIQADKEAAAFSLARVGWKGSPVALQDTLAFDTVLCGSPRHGHHRDDRQSPDDHQRIARRLREMRPPHPVQSR